ncbi:MAG: glycosyltransferase family 2 protein [Candidatus Theseobacter exili]|nr:glycosyltransferase family 2 protein [Candidatus Theseobacter exili]
MAATNNNTPLLSIVMPVYNCSSYLKDSIDSVIEQTFTDWELIAIDDCSTDDSLSILKSYADKDARIVVLSQSENIGVGACLDKAIEHARGKLIARMDGDDICLPNRLELQVNYLKENKDIIGLGGQVILINEEGEHIGYKNFPTDPAKARETMFLTIPIQHPTLIINKELLPDDFTWYDGWRYSEDSNLLFKLSMHGELSNLGDTVLKYRYYYGGNSLKNSRATFFHTYKARSLAIKEYGYKPTRRAQLISHLQYAAVCLLPNALIPKVFEAFRGIMMKLGMTAHSSFSPKPSANQPESKNT